MLAAVAARQGIHSDLVPAIATAFCSGLAASGGQCGALSGGILALSMVEGRHGIQDSRTALYAKTRTLMDSFSQKFGATNCPDLIHVQLGTPEASAAYQERGLKSQCEGYIREVTRRTVELLESQA